MQLKVLKVPLVEHCLQLLEETLGNQKLKIYLKKREDCRQNVA